MKISTFTAFITLVISTFSITAQAEEIRKPNLSITPISETQANAMRASVGKRSSISTTVTFGDENSKRRHQVAHVKVTHQAHLKKHGKQANAIIESIITEYQVQKGDTLSEIAKKYDTTTEHLMSINNLKTSKILVGQMLKI